MKSPTTRRIFASFLDLIVMRTCLVVTSTNLTVNELPPRSMAQRREESCFWASRRGADCSSNSASCFWASHGESDILSGRDGRVWELCELCEQLEHKKQQQTIRTVFYVYDIRINTPKNFRCQFFFKEKKRC